MEGVPGPAPGGAEDVAEQQGAVVCEGHCFSGGGRSRPPRGPEKQPREGGPDRTLRPTTSQGRPARSLSLFLFSLFKTHAR